ncbi:MAG: glycerol kinase, partial [Microthrixaceae bacterium]|nr:glycerol kinase [Microthrixaceae bacterium]
MAKYVMAIDQGTTSTRAILFTEDARIAGSAQREHEQIFPRPGWVEHDPEEIWANVRWVIEAALEGAGARADDVAAIGITNQRETAIVWNRHTGTPIHNAIVWQDTRTQPLIDALAEDGGLQRFAASTGLPLATYFSASKIAWMLEHVAGAREAAEAGDLLFGTPDTWLLWNLTRSGIGGDGAVAAEPVHATDVTNASR